ncbi:MAG: hypothetical protein ACRERD_35390, partial [Candidatus Binatia bacterium]
MATRKKTPDILAERPTEGGDTPGMQKSESAVPVDSQVRTQARPSTRKAGDPVAAIFPQERTRQSVAARVKLTIPSPEGIMSAVKAYLTLDLRAL